MPKHKWTPRQLHQLPELRHIDPTDAFIRRMPVWLRTGLTLLLFFLTLAALLFASVALFGHGIGDFLDNPGPTWAIHAGLVLLIAAVPIAAIAGAFGSFLGGRIQVRMIRTELRRRSIPICLSCGYEGGDIHAPRCPECGTQHATE